MSCVQCQLHPVIDDKQESRTLPLHRAKTTVLCIGISDTRREGEDDVAYTEEQPLDHLAVILWVRFGVKTEDSVFVIVVREVHEDSGGLEHAEVFFALVDEDRNPSIGIHGQEPWFLAFVTVNVVLRATLAMKSYLVPCLPDFNALPADVTSEVIYEGGGTSTYS